MISKTKKNISIMQLFDNFKIQFEQPNWQLDPELGLIDSILDQHPHLIAMLKEDIIGNEKPSQFGRKDTPTVEQIVRAAIFQEIKKLDYRELAYAQEDSRICAKFLRIDEKRPFSYQVYHKYISKIQPESLEELLVEINKIAINEGLEDIERLRQDSTVVESDIHYPTNNALIWDCIKTSQNHLKSLAKEINEGNFRDYTKGAKKTYFKINVTKPKDKKRALFQKQLVTFTKSINQISNVIKKKENYDSIKVRAIIDELERLLPIMKQVYDVAYRKEINGEKVPNHEKIFSIYEPHTDIIVKGGRDVEFGHKINLATGASDLVLHCDILQGNPSDKKLYAPMLDKVIDTYGKVPRDSSTDGGYASLENRNHAKKRGIVNIVFNKIVGSLKNQVSSQNIETRLKKWRSGIEANISNIKRGFNLRRCRWKGWTRFKAKVLWSIIAYNIRVMTKLLVAQL